MRSQSRCACVVAAAGAAASLFVASTAMATVFPSSVIATRFNLNNGSASVVPGLPADQQQAADDNGASVVWNNPQFSSPGLSTSPAIDGAGNVVFFGVMSPTSYTDLNTLQTTYLINSSNQQAIFRSSAASGYAFNAIQIIARDGSATDPVTSTTSSATLKGGPTPAGMPSGWKLNSTSNGTGLAAGVGITPNGTVMIASAANGTGATSTNNTGMFTGPFGGLTKNVFRSDAAPGIAGDTLATNLNLSPQTNQVNNAGQVVFGSALAGPDVVTSGATQNDSALFVNSPSGGSLIARRGDSPAFLNGAAWGAFTTNPGGNNINHNGDVLFSNTLATTQGSNPATSANNAVLAASVGGQVYQIVRSGDAVTVNGNAEHYLGTNQAFTVPPPNTSGPAWNNNSRAVFGVKYAPSATITANTNDQALMTWRNGLSTSLFHTGDTQAPGISDTFSSIGGNAAINNNDNIAFTGSLTPNGTYTSSNNAGIWFTNAATPGSGSLIAQMGQTAPGSGGATFGNGFFGTVMNNNDYVLFTNTLSDGRSGLFAYSPDTGLFNVLFSGDRQILGNNYPVSTFSYRIEGNGEGGVQSFNDLNQLVLGVSSSAAAGGLGANFAIVVIQIPAPGTGMLGLAGLGMLARRRRR